MKYVNLTEIYLFSESREILNTGSRNKRDAKDDGDVLTVLPRIPNPIVCLSSGDMLIFHLTINHTGNSNLVYFHVFS